MLELLVASLLLGMLVTILTMLFNQSSISWRIGTAGVAKLDEVRDNVALIRDQADNAYIWNNKVHYIVGLWREDGTLRDRAWDVNETVYEKDSLEKLTENSKINEMIEEVGSGESSKQFNNYTINVKSAGPNKKFNDYDDIWSYPDEIN